MAPLESRDRVAEALGILFLPEDKDVARPGPVLLGRDELRAAFRARALQTHPDRARVLGLPSSELRDRFEKVVWAFRELDGMVGRAGHFRLWPGPGPQTAAPGPVTTERPSARKEPERQHVPSAEDHFFHGQIPRRSLLFGQFSYYAGAVSWGSLAAAVAWQRRQRPLIGRLAVELGFLARDEVRQLLEHRRQQGAWAERFADFAWRVGYLSTFQRLALVGTQRRLQRPIGRFFVEEHLLEEAEVDSLLALMRRHNLRFSSSEPGR